MAGSEYAGHKDFDSDGNQDDAAENGSFSGKPGSEFPADQQAADTDDEGHRRDDQGTDQGHGEFIFGNGESHGKGVYGGGNALEEQGRDADFGLFRFSFLIFVFMYLIY